VDAADMKVLLLSNGFQPNYEKAFANGLAANGVGVDLISSDRTLVNELVAGVQAINLRGSQDPRRSATVKAMNLLRYAFVLGRYIRSGKHDVVHLTGLFMTRNVLAGGLEWLAYRLLARRFFMTVHNLLPHGRHGLFYRLLHHLIYRLPHRLVVHTEKMKAGLMQAFDVQGERIIVMPHGVDAVPAVLRVPPPSDTLRVLLFGGLNRYKGTDLLLSALEYCPELKVEVVIAGEACDAAYIQEIETLIAGLGKHHTVRWDRGFIAEDQVAGYFESADVVALPYRHIDQSGVLFTAFRFGVPIIATDVGAFRECLPNFAGLIVNQPEPQALAQGVCEFHSRMQSFDRARIREHAQSLVWPRTVEPLITAYRKACI
jgi:glycosyltransferase involved in cell wall biosynthesis